MNPVEIEEAVSNLALEPFDRVEFPFQFLRAFGNKDTAIARLKAGNTNQSDVPGAVLQRGNIHIAACAPGAVDDTLKALRESPKTASQKVKFILATDGEAFQAEDMNGGGTVACSYAEFPDHFGFFLPLAGITTVEQIRESSFDIKATGRLNKLYVELLKDNPDWASRREDMNHFMARLIFCFFAEDTDIFLGEGLFSKTIEQMSARDSSDTHLVMAEIFRAMDTKPADREAAGIKRYANQFPYVNGQLFSGSTECPRFSKIARSYLLHIGSLNWQKINPDIFGSMIQAVADDEERGALGMHYTSVPNILKVLNPLFLDDLRAKLEEAGDNPRKLLNLRQRMAKIRVFDPACGSGNFLVIAYKEMRAIEAEINKRRGEPDRRSDIPLTNFRGIELRDFPAEIARLALIIAEYQCDVLYRGQKEALAEFLPLDSQNWITCGNALRLDWLSICPPTGTAVRVQADDLFSTPLDQAEIDFENEGGETYICGNPPYLGSTGQNRTQKEEIRDIANGRSNSPGFLDYIAGWLMKAADFIKIVDGKAAFVCTNSICQGIMVPILWPIILSDKVRLAFAYQSFKWKNLASNNAGVIVVIVGLSTDAVSPVLFETSDGDVHTRRVVDNINPYLTAGENVVVEKSRIPMSCVSTMTRGNMPYDAGNFLLSSDELAALELSDDERSKFIRKIIGSDDFINGKHRYAIWIEDQHLQEALGISDFAQRIEMVKKFRLSSSDKGANALARRAHQMKTLQIGNNATIIVPAVSSERRPFLPVGYLDSNTALTNLAFALFDAPLWNMALIASRLHLVWIATVCGKLKTDFRYSNTLGWNTFPVPSLTDQNKVDLTRCAEDILLAREAHFPATIADLYDSEAMPDDLRAAHDRNDEVLERIYIGRRFRNDTERLEKLFELYTKMTAKGGRGKAA
ncbi:class I SAM-dependent DNA methyltransferase [Novosphingobium subterraneum]|uniref:site-specific DNA-methyltransferase (adenine-specific) n=1 Tax=Novosphingobium subterraneum TaxID=48936 RepID=A0A0B8ZRQ5_9SPHN|nr:DNA methyltransferase [Novosphingobium subterraneum]KHS45830.1 type II restriction enzyme, methylase subunit [Novosphingobium subterraneum]